MPVAAKDLPRNLGSRVTQLLRDWRTPDEQPNFGQCLPWYIAAGLEGAPCPFKQCLKASSTCTWCRSLFRKRNSSFGDPSGNHFRILRALRPTIQALAQAWRPYRPIFPSRTAFWRPFRPIFPSKTTFRRPYRPIFPSRTPFRRPYRPIFPSRTPFW